MSNAHYELDGSGASPMDRRATKLLYVSMAKYGDDWHCLLHTHACTEIFYVVGGGGYFRVSDRDLPVAVDDLVIINPGVEHTEFGTDTNPLEYIVLGVEGLEFFTGEEGDSRYSVVSFRGSRESVRPYLRSMLREVEDKAAGYEIVCQDLLEVVVVRLMRHTDFSLTLEQGGRRSSKECALVKRYLDGHFKESISLDTLAEQAHVNKYYLVHAFRKEFGVTPISYLIDRRIRESKYLLSDTNHSLSQIAQMLGFSSPSYFSQSFRKATDMSPQEYRRASAAGP